MTAPPSPETFARVLGPHKEFLGFQTGALHDPDMAGRGWGEFAVSEGQMRGLLATVRFALAECLPGLPRIDLVAEIGRLTSRYPGQILDFPVDALTDMLTAAARNQAIYRPYRISEAQMQALVMGARFAASPRREASALQDLATDLGRLDMSLRLSGQYPRIRCPLCSVASDSEHEQQPRHSPDAAAGSVRAFDQEPGTSFLSVGCVATPTVGGGAAAVTAAAPADAAGDNQTAGWAP